MIKLKKEAMFLFVIAAFEERACWSPDFNRGRRGDLFLDCFVGLMNNRPPRNDSLVRLGI